MKKILFTFLISVCMLNLSACGIKRPLEVPGHEKHKKPDADDATKDTGNTNVPTVKQ